MCLLFVFTKILLFIEIKVKLPKVRNNFLYYNYDHNILRVFDVLPNFPFTTSETKPD